MKAKTKAKLKKTARKASDAISSVGLSIALARPVKVKEGVAKIPRGPKRTKTAPKPGSLRAKMTKPFPGGKNAGQMAVGAIKKAVSKVSKKDLSPQARQYKKALKKIRKSGGSSGKGVGY